jgi:hypothetical protein
MSGIDRPLHRFLLRASLALAQIFSWVFVFQYFYFSSGTLESATVSLALTYALTQVITILLSPVAAAALRHGYRTRMACAVLAVTIAYAALALSFANTSFSFVSAISVFAVCMGFYRAFYWAPYSIAIRSEPGGTRSRTEYVLALLPFIGGFFLQQYNGAPAILFGIAAMLALVSLAPLLSMRDSQEGFSWGYRETFHQLFVGAHRRTTLASILQGIEMSLLLIVWPIIVFVILGWSYALLGVVLSFIYVLSIPVRGLMSHPTMTLSTPTRALFAASAWIMRLSVSGSVGIILIDTYYYGGSNTPARGFDMLTFEHAADNTSYVDEYTVLKEISMAMGRLVMALLVAVLASHMSVTYTFAIVFALAAIAAATGIFISAKSVRL